MSNVKKQSTDELTEQNIKDFWLQVDKRGPDDCWEWTGARNKDGRGRMYVAPEMRLATHILYKSRTGEWVPKGHCITHKICGWPPCCNPKHPRLGTAQSNMNDRIADGHSGQKLTIVKVLKIKQRLAQGVMGTELAEEFSVSGSHISNIKNGNRWAHIAA